MTNWIPSTASLLVAAAGLALSLAGSASATEPKVPSSRHGDAVGALMMDQMPRPDGVRRAPGTPSQPKLVRGGSQVTPTPTGADAKGSDRPLVRNGFAGKKEPVKPIKDPGKTGGKPGKMTPNPSGTAPPTTAGTPLRPGGDVDPRARRAHAAMTGNADEEEEIAVRPRPDRRPVSR